MSSLSLLGFDTGGVMALAVGLFCVGAGVRMIRNPLLREDASEVRTVLAKAAGVGLVLLSLFWFFLASVGFRW